MDAFPASRVRDHRPARSIAAQLVLILLPILGLWAPTPGHSALQGSRGTSTTGSVDIVYVQGLNVRINGLADLPLGIWSGSGILTASDDICIGRTGVPLFSAAGTYRILASGDGEPGDPGAFTLSNGIGRIHYRAFFNDQTGTAGRQELTGGVALTGQNSFGLWYTLNMIFNCAVQNANISVEVPVAELTGAAGIYAGTLTLVLIPE